MIIRKNGLYLDRIAHEVGITHDRGEGQTWRWLTTRGYYVTTDGRASIAGGDVREDLVKDITPSAAQVAGMDSMMGALS
jgi:hypothetical protein